MLRACFATSKNKNFKIDLEDDSTGKADLGLNEDNNDGAKSLEEITLGADCQKHVELIGRQTNTVETVGACCNDSLPEDDLTTPVGRVPVSSQCHPSVIPVSQVYLAKP